MNALRRLMELISRYYDRILAVLAVVLLLGALAWSGIRLAKLSGDQRDFSRRMTSFSPEFPEAPAVAVDPYVHAEQMLHAPPQMATWSNALLVPETRCWCIDCLRPITLSTDVCPFCGFQQPSEKINTTQDSDYDGMPDLWEKEHGLDPRNAGDSALDPDNDGFTNGEEFTSETNPAKAESHPPYATKLIVGPVETQPFKLQFKSVLSVPDGSKKFALNTRDSRTYFAKLGDHVEEFEVASYVEKFEEQDVGGVRRRVNLSVLTLRRGGKDIPLTMGRLQDYVEYRVSLIFTPDQTKLPAKPGETVTVRGEAYKVIAVDIRKGTVVIEQLPSGQRFDIRKQSQPQPSEQTSKSP